MIVRHLTIQLLLLLVFQVAGEQQKPFLSEKSQKADKDGMFGLCEDEHGRWHYFEEGEEKTHRCQNDVVKLKYSNQINETGWAYVEVEVSPRIKEGYEQGYAAGFVEGRATRELIRLHSLNTVDGYCEGAEQFCVDLKKYLILNYLWMQNNIAIHSDVDYWKQVNITLNQLLGMIDGYDGILRQHLTVKQIISHPIYLIQLSGDLEDLEEKMNKTKTLRSTLGGKGHCSALIKLLPDFSDVYFSHVTWTSYSTMLRMQKRYTFTTGDPGQTYTFSGYPGSITSNDDFVLTSAHLAILETTFSNYNHNLHQYITPNSLFCWIRAQVAHRKSTSGAEWVTTFSKFNSGTYTNQWSVLDYKVFKKHSIHHPSQGLLYVLEQLPNNIAHGDLTDVLVRNGYWPSYNSPYFPLIANLSQRQIMVDRFGDWFSYDKTPRALIFHRDQGSVVDMDSMIRLMRSNNYTKDPFARCNCTPPYSAENAVSARSDLNPPNGSYPFSALKHRAHGSTDVKVTGAKLVETLSFTAIAGPTHDPTPVFDWTTAPFKHIMPHNGQPDRWEFKPVTHQWTSSLYNGHRSNLISTMCFSFPVLTYLTLSRTFIGY